MKGQVNCFQCKHFYTTWNPTFPRACAAYGFKAKEMPSQLVFHATGIECMAFESKHSEKRKKNPSISSNFDVRL
ncbi:uracil-DNA glycosylase [Halobacillus sp. K22]|uniref:uracil-DNA glycosylase n=1 Tax=Halobacillus sp. K22 TaxID=3457431 RepID=UPI003FCDD11A